ncbi:MAG: type II toxin-antitoxin system RelE family toxin [Chryseotalea sp.]
MKVVFDKSFLKSIKKIKNTEVEQSIATVIQEVEQAHSIRDILSVKKLQGYKSYYRIRVGSYRIGIKLIDKTTVEFIVAASRDEIYRIFP